MTWEDARKERRELKQKLFFIRRLLEGQPLKLDAELQALKKQFEEMPGFTCWEDFPEKWDIGDPNKVKEATLRGNDKAFNDLDKQNVEKILGKPYFTIVHLEHKKD